MENNQFELVFEQNRLTETISLAQNQLCLAQKSNEENKSAIIAAKKDLRENTSHSISGLWGSDGFEALVEMSQYADPVNSKIADYEAVENKIARLEKMIKSPYFARIDFKFDEEEDFEKIYIGRASLKKEDTYEQMIYDWRSPIASVFYRFVSGPVYYDAPGGRITGWVQLKRQYEINDGSLEYYFDAEVQIEDKLLRKLLAQSTSPKMKTIVETIQKEQDIVIRDMENGLMMVQGVAGSGKTSIALHRAAYLMYQGLSSQKLSANNIIIISPNTLFEQYISNVIPELGEENVVSLVFEEILTKILPNKRLQSRNQYLENLITSSGYRNIIKNSIEFKTSIQFLTILERYLFELPYRWIPFEDVYYQGRCIVSKEVLKEKVVSKAKETPLGVRLKQLEKFILSLLFETKPADKSEVWIVRKEIQKFTELSIEEMYRRLFLEKEYFYSLAQDIKLPSGIDEIVSYTLENLNAPVLYYDDAAVLAYLKLKVNGSRRYYNMKQVIIDEAQDYYPLHFEIFHLLFAKSKFTVLGDINQTLEKEEDVTLYEQIKNILNQKKSSLVTLDKSFRCTNEILKYSLKFIDQTIEIKSFNRKGEEPRIYTAKNRLTLTEMIALEVNRCLEKGCQSIGLICKNAKNALSLFDSLKAKMAVQLIKNDSKEEVTGVFIIPVYMSKGLEFDAVLICDADLNNYYREDDKKLLYIAATRALHQLTLFCQGEPSPFV